MLSLALYYLINRVSEYDTEIPQSQTEDLSD